MEEIRKCKKCDHKFDKKERAPISLIPCGHNMCEKCYLGYGDP
jgi:hypothetical protein